MQNSLKKQNLFVTCIPGFEKTLLAEVEALGFTAELGKGGVYTPFINFDQIYTLNLWLRTASRVLLPIAEFPIQRATDLYSRAMRIDWTRFFRHMPSFCIDAQSFHRDFTNSLYAAQLLKDAICDVLRKFNGKRPDIDTKNPELRLNLFIDQTKATISFDTSGIPLNQRGYRYEAGPAPLREHLAASLLLTAGFTGKEDLVDPVCGSGTFLIEAAMIATNTAPGSIRPRFGFMSHPQFSPGSWQKMLQEAKGMRKEAECKIAGVESDPLTFSSMQKAIARTELGSLIQIQNGDFRTAELPFAPKFIIANPPYGIRLEDTEEHLIELYQSLGDFMKNKSNKPAVGAIFTGSEMLSKKVGLASKRRIKVLNGGIDCRLLIYDLYINALTED